MKQNRITVFNCIIDKRIEDCDFFENLLDNHYQKFSYGYDIVAKDKLLEKIKDVECEILNDTTLKFVISFKKSVTKKIFKQICESSTCAYGSECYAVDIESNGDNILLTIYDRFQI